MWKVFRVNISFQEEILQEFCVVGWGYLLKVQKSDEGFFRYSVVFFIFKSKGDDKIFVFF